MSPAASEFLGAPETTVAGDAGGVLTPDDFPFKSAKDVADVIVERTGL